MRWISFLILVVGCSPDVNSDRCGPDGCPLGQRCDEDFCVPAGDAATRVDGAVDASVADASVRDAVSADAVVRDAAPPPDATPVVDAAPAVDAARAADAAPAPVTCDGDHPPAFDGDGRPCADDDTLALWRFDGDTNAVAGPGRPAPRFQEEPAEVRLDPSPRGGAARFGGTAGQSFRMHGPVRDRPPFTVELWVNPDASGHEDRALVSNASLVPLSGVWSAGWELALVRTEAHLYTPVFRWAASEGLFADGKAELPSDAPPIRTGEWSRVVVSVTADGTPTLVVNDFRTTGVDRLPTGGGNAADLSLGDRTGDAGVAFSGLLDEVRISVVAR
jgi:hypothetical protein